MEPTSPPPRPIWAAVLFHASGLVMTALGLFVGVVGLLFLSWGTASCRDRGIPGDLGEYRASLVVLGLAIAAVPAFWALVAAVLRFRWWPWLAVAAVAVGYGILLAVTTDEVPVFCSIM